MSIKTAVCNRPAIVSGSQEYVRADLYAALEAKLAEARKALEQAEQQLDYGQVDAAHKIILRALGEQ